MTQNAELQTVEIKILAVSPFGQPIELANSCSYFKHERLIYWVESTEPQFDQSAIINNYLQLNMHFSVIPKTLHFRLLDGVLAESGVLVKYYANDNLLCEPLATKIMTTTTDF